MSTAIALPDLATTINQRHLEAQSHAKKAVERAIECGEALIQAKAQVAHGEWLPWLEANTAINERTARRYMRVSDHREELESKTDNVSDLTLRGALELLSEPDVDWWSGIHSDRLSALIAESDHLESELGEPMPDNLEGLAQLIWTSSGRLEAILINKAESRSELAHLMEARNKQCRTNHKTEDIRAWKKKAHWLKRFRQKAHRIVFQDMKGCTPPAGFECACGEISEKAA